MIRGLSICLIVLAGCRAFGRQPVRPDCGLPRPAPRTWANEPAAVPPAQVPPAQVPAAEAPPPRRAPVEMRDLIPLPAPRPASGAIAADLRLLRKAVLELGDELARQGRDGTQERTALTARLESLERGVTSVESGQVATGGVALEVAGHAGKLARVAELIGTWAPVVAAGIAGGGVASPLLMSVALWLLRARRLRTLAGGAVSGAPLPAALAPPASHALPGVRACHAAPSTITIEQPPPPQVIVPETQFVAVERDAFAQAFAAASRDMVQRWPSAQGSVETLRGLIDQHLSAQGLRVTPKE